MPEKYKKAPRFAHGEIGPFSKEVSHSQLTKLTSSVVEHGTPRPPSEKNPYLGMSTLGAKAEINADLQGLPPSLALSLAPSTRKSSKPKKSSKGNPFIGLLSRV